MLHNVRISLLLDRFYVRYIPQQKLGEAIQNIIKVHSVNTLVCLDQVGLVSDHFTYIPQGYFTGNGVSEVILKAMDKINRRLTT